MSKDLVSLRNDREKAFKAFEALGTDAPEDEFNLAEKTVKDLDAEIEKMARLNALRSSAAIPGNLIPGNAPVPGVVSRDGVMGAERRFESFGDMLRTVIAADSRAGSGRVDDRLIYQSFTGADFNAATGMSEGVGTDGGFLVQQDFATDLIKRAYDRSQLWSRARRLPLGPRSNGIKLKALKEISRANGSRFGGAQVYWTAEGAAKTASELRFREMDMRLHKLAGLVYLTDELLDDAPALEMVVNEAFEEEFAFKLDDAFFEGTGAGMPLGVLNSPALITVSKEGSQAADTLVAENILKMWSRLYMRSRSTAIWTISQQLEPQLYQMNIKVKNVAGTENVGGFALPQVVWVPPGSQNNNQFGLLMGRPVIATEFNSAPGDKGDILLCDPREYLTIDKGMTPKRDVSIHVRFVYDETAFRFVIRVDGQPIWEAALTPFKGTDTTSPYVTLEAR